MSEPLEIRPTKDKAEKWARRFDYARRCNGLPLLVVLPYHAEFGVINPDPTAVAQPYKEPT